ncbi:MAG: hypothetical protein ACLTMR_00165 [Faecalibacillus sp.]
MLGKPKKRRRQRMLELLSNNKQVVITAVLLKINKAQHLQMQQLLHLKII